MPRKARRNKRKRRGSGRGTKRNFDEMSRGYLYDSDSGDERRVRTEGPMLTAPLTHPLRFPKPQGPRGRRRRNKTKKQERMDIEDEEDNNQGWFGNLFSGGRKRKSRRKKRRKRRKSRKRRR